MSEKAAKEVSDADLKCQSNFLLTWIFVSYFYPCCNLQLADYVTSEINVVRRPTDFRYL